MKGTVGSMCLDPLLFLSQSGLRAGIFYMFPNRGDMARLIPKINMTT